MRAQEVRERVGGVWVERSDGWWLTLEKHHLQEVARTLKVEDVRFAALTLRPEGESMKSIWHCCSK